MTAAASLECASCGRPFGYRLDLERHRVEAHAGEGACQCGHDVTRHHPAGVCVVVLPPFAEEELPAWRCPCRRYKPERLPAVALATVQSCTVAPAPRVPDQRERSFDPYSEPGPWAEDGVPLPWGP